jgi:hypothetical protein
MTENRPDSAASEVQRWMDKNLCVRCEQPLTSPTPCQPGNLPSRPNHKSVVDLMGQKPLGGSE